MDWRDMVRLDRLADARGMDGLRGLTGPEGRGSRKGGRGRGGVDVALCGLGRKKGRWMGIALRALPAKVRIEYLLNNLRE